MLIEGATNCAHIREFLHCGAKSEIARGVEGAEVRIALTPQRRAVRGELASTVVMQKYALDRAYHRDLQSLLPFLEFVQLATKRYHPHNGFSYSMCYRIRPRRCISKKWMKIPHLIFSRAAHCHS
jgi:hypothetical protein